MNFENLIELGGAVILYENQVTPINPLLFAPDEFSKFTACQVNHQEMKLGNHQRELERQSAILQNHNAGLQMLQQNTKILTAQMEQLERRSRKAQKVIIHSQVGDVEGQLNKLTTYSDGSCRADSLFNAPYGALEAVLLLFEEVFPNEELFALTNNRDIFIIGKIRKLTGQYLYSLFVKSGLYFNPQITRAQIQELLYQYFAPRILTTSAVYKLVEYAGWHQNKYWTAEDFKIANKRDLPTLPVFKKSFGTVVGTLNCNKYFDYLLNVLDEKLRLILAIVPLAGILNSVLTEENFEINFVVNFVVLGELDIRSICSFLKTFNRENFMAHSLDVSTKQMNDILLESNDEMLVFESINMTSEDSYRIKKVSERKDYVTDICTRKRNLSFGGTTRSVNLATCFISSGSCLRRDVINVFVEKDMFLNSDCLFYTDLRQDDLIKRFFVEFICFATKHMEDIRCLIQKAKNSHIKSNASILKLLYDILILFWEAYGVDFCKKMELSSKPDFEEWFADNMFVEEDLIGGLIRSIRRRISDYHMIEKCNAVSKLKNEIYFDDCFVWIPVDTFECMLLAEGIFDSKNKFLEIARNDNLLKSDREGFTRRLQIGKNRFETYQFYRERLNLPGYADIIELGREID